VANNTSYAADVLLDLARQKERPVFKRKPQAYIQEAQVMLRGVQGYLDHVKKIKLPEKAQKIFQRHKEALTKIITKGKISSRDARAVQKALVSCFQWISHTKNYKR